MLADLIRTDRHHHRPAKGDSGLAEAVKVLARGHQQLVWARQRQANIVRSALRAFYPAALAAFGGDPGGRDAVAVLRLTSSPELGRALSHPELVAAPRRAGRRRQVEARAAAIQVALASQQLEAPPVVAGAYAQVVAAATAVIARLSEQITSLEVALAGALGAHPDAAIVHSPWCRSGTEATGRRRRPAGMAASHQMARVSVPGLGLGSLIWRSASRR
jgi:hypothetical protein